jgi:bacillithiol biosynthesis deacetylase BshB1
MGKCLNKMVDIKLDILAIGVHPDDVELSCGATLLKHVDIGYKAGILDLTKGELGTRGTAELRLREAEAARAYAGIEIRDNLGLRDGFFVNDDESKMAIIRKIRQYRPDIVLANAIRDRHPDHGRAALLTSESCFLAGLSKIKTSYQGKDQQHWRPKKVYHYIQDNYIEPDIVIDISGYLDRKFEMIACFKSQFYDPNSREEETPISSKQFMDHLKGRAVDFGRRISVEYGEGFTSESYIGVSDLYKLI